MWADVLTRPTEIIYIAVVIISTFCIANERGHRLYYLSLQQISAMIKLDWIAAPFRAMALAAIKTSVALFILRLLGSKATWSKWFLYCNNAVISVVSTSLCIITFVQRSPLRALWEEVVGSKY